MSADACISTHIILSRQGGWVVCSSGSTSPTQERTQTKMQSSNMCTKCDKQV